MINGAEINIRKEFTGSYYSINEVDSEIVYDYSFETIKNLRYKKMVFSFTGTKTNSQLLKQ